MPCFGVLVGNKTLLVSYPDHYLHHVTACGNSSDHPGGRKGGGGDGGSVFSIFLFPFQRAIFSAVDMLGLDFVMLLMAVSLSVLLSK